MTDNAAPQPDSADHFPAVGNAARKTALALLCTAQLTLVLDFSIVNVALPSIGRDLEFTPTGLQWVITAYALSFGGFLLLGGRAADYFGRRRIFIWGLLLFVAASLLGGLARADWMLVAARALQGIGGAAVAPATLSLVTTTFPEGPERNRAVSWLGTMSTIGFAVGMVLGGLLTDEVGWPWVMFVNVPVGIAVAALAVRVLPADHDLESTQGFDFAGAALVTGASATLVYALSEASTHGLGAARTLTFLAAGAIQTALFVLLESRIAHPLVPLSVFRRRNLMGANITGFFLASAAPAMVLMLTFHMQRERDYSPLLTGLAFVPNAMAATLASRLVPRAVARVGTKPCMVAGGALLAAGLLFYTNLDPHRSYVLGILPGMLVAPIGVLFGFISSMIVATNGMPNHEQGLASGLLTTFQQLGMAFGLAVIVGVTSDANPGDGSAYHAGFTVAAGFALAASAVALFVVKPGSRGAAPHAAAAALH